MFMALRPATADEHLSGERVGYGRWQKNYGTAYRSVQGVETGLPRRARLPRRICYCGNMAKKSAGTRARSVMSVQ
jgi:hypothetical protein